MAARCGDWEAVRVGEMGQKVKKRSTVAELQIQKNYIKIPSSELL